MSFFKVSQHILFVSSRTETFDKIVNEITQSCGSAIAIFGFYFGATSDRTAPGREGGGGEDILIGPRTRLGSDIRNHTLLYRLIFSNKDQNSQSCCDEGDWMTCFLKPCSLKCSGWFKYMSVRFCIYSHVTILHIQVTSLQQMFWWTGLKTMTYITWLCITGLMSLKHRYTKRPGRPKKKKKKRSELLNSHSVSLSIN